MEVESPLNNKQVHLMVSGFNGFGQFGQVGTKRKLQNFEEILLTVSSCATNDDEDDNKNVMLALSWSYLALAYGPHLQLQGFLSDTPQCLSVTQCPDNVQALAVCDKYCLVLLCNGRLYKCLPEIQLKLEEIKFQLHEEEDARKIAKKRNIFGTLTKPHSTAPVGPNINCIACGNNIIIAISKSNVVFSHNTMIYQFEKHVKIKQLQCGFEHAVLLTTNGDVYSWGNGLRGQLGQDVLSIQETPSIVDALAGIKITCISANGWHTAAISAFGDIYTWGYNSNGQLGLRIYKDELKTLKEPAVYPLPQLLDAIACKCLKVKSDESSPESTAEECSPLRVITGARHTVVLMNCGRIYAAGWNAHCQLGLEPENNETCVDSFSFVCRIQNARQKKIICGDWCTLIY